MKSENFFKRFLAYLIDIAFLLILFGILNFFIKGNPNIKILNMEATSINELFLNHNIGFSTYLMRYAQVVQDLDKERVLFHLVNCIFILIYFILIPYFMGGKTIGKKIMKLKVVRRDQKKLTLTDLTIRNIIINGFGFLLIGLILLYLVPSIAYFILTILLGILQIILVFVSVFMVIYRKDNRGLHDIISTTCVVKED